MERACVTRFNTFFGITVDAKKDPERYLQALQQLDPRYKEGRDLVRYELESDPTNWSEGAVKAIMDCAKSMRMLELETPLEGCYNLVIALAGARQSNLDRLRYAARNDPSKVQIGKLVIAGSTRILKEAEQANVANYAPGAETEADLCYEAADVVMVESGIDIEVVIVENERAGNQQVIEAALDDEDDLSGARVAVITTEIFWMAAMFDIRRIGKRYGILDASAAGTPSDPEIIKARTPASYYSEVLRTLRAIVLAYHAGV